MGLYCVCGEKFDTVTFPLESSGVMLSDKAIDDNDKRPMSDAWGLGRHYNICQSCGRIAIGVKGEQQVEFYKPE